MDDRLVDTAGIDMEVGRPFGLGYICISTITLGLCRLVPDETDEAFGSP